MTIVKQLKFYNMILLLQVQKEVYEKSYHRKRAANILKSLYIFPVVLKWKIFSTSTFAPGAYESPAFYARLSMKS